MRWRWEALALALLAAIWLAAFVATGDRRFFFPFTMVLSLWPLALGAAPWTPALLVGLFSAIRLWQQAPLVVLGIELIVAAAAVGVPAWWLLAAPHAWRRKFLALALGAALAYIGLFVN